MLRETYENIVDGIDVRKNLIEIKMALKEERNKVALLYFLAGDYELLYRLLNNEDAKVRKNAAIIMGELAVPEFSDPLFEAYNKEEKLFVKADYLTALKKLDYRKFLPALKERLDELTKGIFEEASLKHINEEKKILTEMILDIEGICKHTFTGYDVLSDLVLLTNRDHREVTFDQIKNAKAVKCFNAGVMARTNNLKEILAIRTYTDMLFRLKDALTVTKDAKAAAKALLEGGLLEFLDERHQEASPYYFRLEIKSTMPLSDKSQFAKKLAVEIESCSSRKLINSTSNYEVEIRLIENKEGVFNVLLKLYTIEDDRFSYRKHTVAASIAPVTAALTAELAKEYLKENAQVLDPFCGVGTMLIERNKLVPANPMYGIDHFGEAIDKAIDNSRNAHAVINFINRDFFDFKHDYLFDEIFTNMPTRGGRKSEDEMAMLYQRFFKKALSVLKDKSVMVLYTRDQHLVKQGVIQNKDCKLVKEYCISKKEGAYVEIIEVDKL